MEKNTHHYFFECEILLNLVFVPRQNSFFFKLALSKFVYFFQLKKLKISFSKQTEEKYVGDIF